MSTCYIVPGRANINNLYVFLWSDYLTLNRKIDEVIRELRQLREIIMQQQQQVVEEQAHVEQMQTEEELSAFCSKLNEERSFRKSMVIIFQSNSISIYLNVNL